jgi:hypothetical protein
MNWWKKVKKAASDTGDAISDTTNDVVNTTTGWYNDSQRVIICTEAITNCALDVQGHDPRKWMSACAAETLFKGKGPEYFKQCLIGKMEKEVKDLSDPQAYAEKLWKDIEKGCS